MTLFEILTTLRGQIAEIIANGGVVEDQMQLDALDKTDAQLADKVHNYVHLIEALEMEADKWDAELKAYNAHIATLRAKRDALNATAGKLRERLLDATVAAGKQEAGVYRLQAVSGGLTYTLSTRRKPPALQVIAPDEIPAEFLKLVPELDKAAIIAKLKAEPDSVPGVKYESSGYSLSIK